MNPLVQNRKQWPLYAEKHLIWWKNQMNQEQQWPARTVSRRSTSSNVHHWLSQLPAYFFAINFPNAISFDIPDGSVFILQGQCVFYASLNGWTLSFRSVPAWPAFCAKSKPTMVKWRPDWTAALFLLLNNLPSEENFVGQLWWDACKQRLHHNNTHSYSFLYVSGSQLTRTLDALIPCIKS